MLRSLAVLGHPALPRPRVHPRRRLGLGLGPSRRTPLPLAERRLHGPARCQARLEDAPQPRQHCSRASRQGRRRREVELGVGLEAERGESGAACQRGRHGAEPIARQVEKHQGRQPSGKAVGHLCESVAAEPKFLEADQARHRLGQRAQEVLAHLEPLEPHELAEALRQALKLVAHEPELSQPPQAANRLGERSQLVAGEPELLHLLQLADLPRQGAQRVRLEPEHLEATQLADVGWE